MRKKLIFIFLITLGLVAAALFVGMRTSTEEDAALPTTDGTTQVQTIAEKLTTPWSVIFYENTALISSRDTAQILELNRTDGSTRVIGTVADSVRRGEGGLLGLAVDDQKRLYAYYTTQTDNRISRFTLSGQPGSLTLGQPETILTGLPSASFHNGGRIAFGPDKLLYVTVGDAGDTKSAQDISKLSGKILRMTPDGDVPANNPFPNSLVYSYGHRNPQGIAWSDDGRMFASEFGQNTWDELNVIEAGANYGWPDVEGIEGRQGYTDPVQQWATKDASPSGITYTNGLLYIANLRGEVLRTVPVNALNTSEELYTGIYGRIRDVAVTPDGTVWFVTNNTDGRGKPSASDDRILSIQKTN